MAKRMKKDTVLDGLPFVAGIAILVDVIATRAGMRRHQEGNFATSLILLICKSQIDGLL